jgi:hypothetical protein
MAALACMGVSINPKNVRSSDERHRPGASFLSFEVRYQSSWRCEEHLKSLRREIQRVDKAELALAERRKTIFDHSQKNTRPIPMPIDTSKNR